MGSLHVALGQRFLSCLASVLLMRPRPRCNKFFRKSRVYVRREFRILCAACCNVGVERCCSSTGSDEASA